MYKQMSGITLRYGILEQERPSGNSYPTDGLVARWEFEDNMTDTDGFYPLSGGGTYTTGIVGNACNFSSSEAQNTSADLREVIDEYKSFSVAFWFRWTSSIYSFQNNMMFAIDGTNSKPYKRFYIRREGNAAVSLGRYHAGYMDNKGGVGCSINYTFNYATWFHLAIVYWNDDTDTGDQNVIYPYVNGTREYIITNANWLTYRRASMGVGSTTGLSIGGNYQNNEPQLNGYIDQFYLYNRALSSSEVSQLYNGGIGI